VVNVGVINFNVASIRLGRNDSVKSWAKRAGFA